METSVGGAAGMKYMGKARLFAGVSCAALALACLTPASAATYFVSTDGQLRAAMTAANGDGDASATIIMTGNVTVGGTDLPTITKPVTIDTQGFTLTSSRISNTGGNLLTLSGTMVGTTAAPGLAVTHTILPSSIINNGSITGGSGATASNGVNLNATTFVNNGTITGGSASAGAGGVGTVARRGSSLTNNGVIQGGNGSGGSGAGVDLGGLGADSTLTNHGIIRGGTSTGGVTGNHGVFVRAASGQVVNTGTIEGGNGALGLAANSATQDFSIANSGTIRAGTGQTTAIGWSPITTPTTGSLTLELQAGSVIAGNVVANPNAGNDLLRLGGSSNWTLDGGLGSASQYRNFDRLEKTGTGTWTLTGSGDFSGPTNIASGTLVVNGSLAGSAVTVQSGAALAGSGAVGATTLLTGSRIAPGNSIGTLTVNGAFAQAAGSTYQVEVDPATTTSDLIRVNGTATLASGAAISVVNYTGAAYVAGQRFTILTSTGLTGSYGFSEQVLSPFLTLRDAYDANNAYLTVIQTRTVASAGSTGNQAEVGRGVDSLPSSNSIQTSMINQPTLDAARTALDQISGEIHASAKTALIDESWLLRAAVNDRLRAAFGGVGAAPMATLNYGFSADLAPSVKGPMPTLNADRFAVWGQGYGSWGRSDSDGNAARLTRSTGGFLLGADAAVFDTLRVGAVAGYSRSVFDVNSRFSSGESDNYHLGLYAGGRWGALSLRTGASYSWHDVETSRTVISSAFGSNLRAGYDAGTAQLFGELGYRIDLGRVAFEPFAGLAYVNLHTDGFNETGGAAALTARGDDTSLGYSTLGLRASTNFALHGMDLTLRGGLAWRHAFGDVDPTTTLAFAGSGAFSIAGIPIARDAAIVEAGLDLAIGKSATLGLAYTGQLAQDTQDHAFKGVLAVRF
ncbi:autotransporter outer membrane beta-barrel domain-containing protein [Bosea vaviloviae]|uniref:Autotransporter domain-containing protein n=1 Tax=Bosea vaviloviae TaxID=1526658 RepID=A0A1D7U0U3_9HYPH|nr:autotransporter domain-containing protein [Bosea vaviloviae]AOO80988.1 hypothetical protein BHK69_11410 [Bosea vaviloviae]